MELIAYEVAQEDSSCARCARAFFAHTIRAVSFLLAHLTSDELHALCLVFHAPAYLGSKADERLWVHAAQSQTRQRSLLLERT